MTKHHLLPVALLLLPCLPSQGVTQTVIYVDDDAGPGGDGTTWTTAHRYLQDALAVAVSGDEIRVGGGAYTPDPTGLADSREATFRLLVGVGIYGGYAGYGAEDPDARDIILYETILSGDLAGDDAQVASPEDLLTEPT